MSGLNLDKVKRAPSAFLSKRRGDPNRDKCKNIKCLKEERVCAKLRTRVEFSTVVMVIHKCELEYMKCNEGMEAIELPMKYCREKEALENARKAPSSRGPNRNLQNIAKKAPYIEPSRNLQNERKIPSNSGPNGNIQIAGNYQSNRRSKRSPAIATKTPNNILAPKVLRKRLGGKKSRINYNSLYFGPRSRKDADADTPDALASEQREKISLAQPNDFINRDVQVSSGDADGQDNSPKRNQEVNSANASGDNKIGLTNNANRDAQAINPEDEAANDGTNKANRDVELSKSAEGDNANRGVQNNNDESPNRGQEEDSDKVEDVKRQKIHLVIQTNSDESMKARDVTLERLNDKGNVDADGEKDGVVLMIKPDNGNRQVEENDKDVDGSKQARDVTVESLKDKDKADSADAEADDDVVLMIKQNNGNRQVEDNDEDVDGSKQARGAPVETLNDKEKVNSGNVVTEDENVLMIKPDNGNRQVEDKDEYVDGSKQARDVTLNDKENAEADDAGAGDDTNDKVVLMIKPGNDNTQVEDGDGPEQGQNVRGVEVEEEDDQGVKPKAIDEGDGEGENKEELKDNQEENDIKEGVAPDTPAGAAVEIVIGQGAAGETPGGDGQGAAGETLGGDGQGAAGETPGGEEGDPNNNDPNKLGGPPPDYATYERPEEQKGNDAEHTSIEVTKPPDYEDVNIDEYKSDCPSVCPARDVMVCARCKEGVYRTFMSICHLRMFNCKHPEEKLELVGRSPCMMSAPYLNDMPKAQGRVREPGDTDDIVEYLRCQGKSALNDPKCKGHAANEEEKKRRYRN